MKLSAALIWLSPSLRVILAPGEAPGLEGLELLKKSVNTGCLTSAAVIALPFATLVSSWVMIFFSFFQKVPVLKERDVPSRIPSEAINRVDLESFTIVTFAPNSDVLMNDDIILRVITATPVHARTFRS